VSTVPPLGSLEPAAEVPDERLVGNALLSNTTACEASRLHQPMSERARQIFNDHALRVCDLMSLIDAVVLHEKIFYLPATLPRDIAELELRNRLVDSGALAALPGEDGHNAIGKTLLASLSTVEGYHRTVGNATPLSFENFTSTLMDELQLTTEKDQADSRPSQLDYGYDFGGFMARAAPQSFDEAAHNLIGWMDYRFSGAYDASMASLRTMYYVFASEHYRLPYLASASVQGVQRRFPNYFQPSVKEKLYEQLASALRAAVETVAHEFDGFIVFVPPFSAIVFHRASTPTSIPSETLALREEYKELRSKLRGLEFDRLEARSLNDRLKVLRQIERLGKEVVRPFDQPSQMKLEPALRYIPDAVGIAANPTNPSGWAQLLLHMPIDALVNWYRRRPVTKLVSTAREVSALPDYDRLLTKHFGAGTAARVQEIQNKNQEHE